MGTETLRRIQVSSIREKEDLHICRLSETDELGQFDYLVDLGLRLGRDGETEVEENRIEGCRTAIWLKMDGRTVRASSDSLVVLGLISILKDIYDGRSPSEIRANPIRFLDAISVHVVYPEMRENGIRRCFEIITASKEV